MVEKWLGDTQRGEQANRSQPEWDPGQETFLQGRLWAEKSVFLRYPGYQHPEDQSPSFPLCPLLVYSLFMILTKPSCHPAPNLHFPILPCGLENPAGPAAASCLALCLPNTAPEAFLVLTKAACLGSASGKSGKGSGPRGGECGMKPGCASEQLHTPGSLTFCPLPASLF